jgi:hypothetical protein
VGAESGHDDGGGQNIRIKSGDRLTVDSAVAQQELIVTLSVIPNLLVLVLTLSSRAQRRDLLPASEIPKCARDDSKGCFGTSPSTG